MIQRKAKNKYWQAGKRWRTMPRTPLVFIELDFCNYQYIIGDKIFTEPTEEAKEAFKAVIMWHQIQS